VKKMGFWDFEKKLDKMTNKWIGIESPKKFSLKKQKSISKKLRRGQAYPRGHKYYGLVKGDEDTGMF